MSDAYYRFQDAIRAAGFEPPRVVSPGKILRFPGKDKRPGNRAGWCLLFSDGAGGCFGDWSTGIYRTWQAKPDRPFSQAERTALDRQAATARQLSEAEHKARQEAASKRAAAIWNAAIPAPGNHPYLVRKRIQLHDAKLHAGALTLPILDFKSRLLSLQFIANDGGKLLLSGGCKRGCFIPIASETADPARVIICEGWATGCTLAESETLAVVLAAIDAGNLEAVAVSARLHWPTAEIVIAGDDDRLTKGNPGATKAHHAAIAAGALLALPQWPAGAPETLTDFNDLAVWLAGSGS